MTCTDSYGSDHRPVRIWFSSCSGEDNVSVACAMPNFVDRDLPVLDETTLAERCLSCAKMTSAEFKCSEIPNILQAFPNLSEIEDVSVFEKDHTLSGAKFR